MGEGPKSENRLPLIVVVYTDTPHQYTPQCCKPSRRLYSVIGSMSRGGDPLICGSAVFKSDIDMSMLIDSSHSPPAVKSLARNPSCNPKFARHDGANVTIDWL